MILTIIFLVILQSVHGGENETEHKTFQFQSSWVSLKQSIRSMLMPILPEAMKVVSNANVSAECQRSLTSFSLSFLKLKSWAIQMIDASGKIPSGVLTGTQTAFGNFEECLKIRVNESSTGSQKQKEFFRGRYCTIGFESNIFQLRNQNLTSHEIPEILKNMFAQLNYLENAALFLGVCLPSACSEDDVQRLSTTISPLLNSKSHVEECHTEERLVWPSSSIAAVCVLCFLLFLCVLGSITDVINRNRTKEIETPKDSRKNTLFETLKIFSVLENTKELLETGSKNDISCFHGFRILTALWIILGHVMFVLPEIYIISKQSNMFHLFEYYGKVSPAVVIEQSVLSVDSFFVLSGFLMVKTTIKQLEENGGKLNLFEFVMHKYWRMTPAFAFSLLLMFTLPVIDSAPLWNSTLNPILKQCEGYWWANFLYINNWLDSDNRCYSVSWFLAALMQLHIVGVCILIAVYRWKCLGVLLGGLIAMSCYAANAMLVVLRNIPIPFLTSFKNEKEVKDYARYFYITPYSHFTSYLIGMIVAYIILKNRERKISPKYQTLGWFSFLFLAMFCFLSPYVPTESRLYVTFFLSVQRTLWSICVGWLIYACVSGFGGFVNSLLSLKMMKPLGQLSFLMYLIHPLVIIYMDASSKERTYFGYTEKVFSFFGTAAVTLVIAYVGYVAVEAPFSKLERVVRRWRKESKYFEVLGEMLKLGERLPGGSYVEKEI